MGRYLLLSVFSDSNERGTILPASCMTWLRNSLTDSHGDELSVRPLPTVDPAISVIKERTVESSNADFAARTSLLCGITSCAN